MAFGIAASKIGLPVWAAILTSLTNVTSAGQFAGINIMQELGGLLEFAITTLIINMRYFLMSLSVSQKVDAGMTLWQRFIVSFGITDEVFAVSMRREGTLTTAYMVGLILTPVIGWTGGTAVGALVTSFMPPIVASAMGIALYGMFIAIVVPPARESRNVLFAVIFAIVASLVFYYAPYLRDLSSGWTIIIITVAVSALCATLFPLRIEEGGNE
ncbi:MAG: AzlC family ABC transporter permease [Clostridia bacterium]|nr:AzlC family ABC transporter permease [Clostridia bacterium]